MKGIEQIAKEFQDIVKGRVFDGANYRWSFYNDINGFFNGKFYGVIFSKHNMRKIDQIIIFKNTDNFNEISDIIKTIEPLAIIETL